MHKSKQMVYILILLFAIQIVQCPKGNVPNCHEQKTGDPTKCKDCESHFDLINWSCCVDTQQHCFSCFHDSNKCDSC